MAKLTLLSIVQKCLSSMDSDDVNSISDTEEALQIADLVEDTYFHLVSEKDWPFLRTTCELESVSDTSRPTHLKVPNDVSRIEDLRYDVTESSDTNKTIKQIRYCDPRNFVDLVLQRNTGNSEVTEVTLESGTPIFVFNDRAPRFWTSFDDEFVVMDAYNSTEETTLIGNKSLVFCYRIPIFTVTDDTFIPDLPDELFPLLLSMCKRAAHVYHKQADSPIDAKRELQGIHRGRRHGWRTNDGKKTPTFGRRRRS